ncbi:Anaphase promoting complex subunit 10 [Neofusicoccum parvum]|nr:Anaphase promoting complex subunit 10 [Neofusicoccum parvum]
MPPATRRRHQPQPEPDHQLDPPSDLDDVSHDDPQSGYVESVMADIYAEQEDEEEEGPPESPTEPSTPPLPPNLKEISSLASWTVSSSKPGCGVPQLRSPSTSLFWQSDGPQPHYLNIHFFKVVEIVAMRIYLDFDQDESYTPTKIAFLAGMGEMDLQEWGVMSFVEPRGWVNVDFEGVGAVDGSGDEDSGSEDELGDDEGDGENGPRRKMKLPILRAMLVQVKILENHQNGKDTHLRGLQIFAKDKAFKERRDLAKRLSTSGVARNLVVSLVASGHDFLSIWSFSPSVVIHSTLVIAAIAVVILRAQPSQPANHYTMNKFTDIAKGGWHPEKNSKPSYSQEPGIKDRAKGLLGRGNKDPYAEQRNHQSKPLSSLKDPATFAPPPKHQGYYGNGATGSSSTNTLTPASSGLGAPLTQNQVQASQQRQIAAAAYEEEEENKPPPGNPRGSFAFQDNACATFGPLTEAETAAAAAA